MTHRLASVRVKTLYDKELNETLWVFFCNGITEPLLILPQFEMEQLAAIVATTKAAEEAEEAEA